MIKDLDKELIPLIDRISQGDENAFNDFYQRAVSFLQTALQRRFYWTGLTDHEQDDILQDSILRFYQYLRDENVSIRIPSLLLYKITRNKSIDSYRKKKRRSAILGRTHDDVPDRHKAPSHELETHDEAEVIIKKYFPRLSSASRAVIESILLQGRSFQETADILGIEVNAARVRYHRAIQQLRDLLKQGDHELKRIQDNLSRLEERDRSILELVLIQGVSPKDAAALLDVQPATIYKRYERALKRLEKLMNVSKDL